MIKKFLIFTGLSSCLFAQNVNYITNNVDAYLPKNGQFDLLLGYELVNDAVDVLSIKENEFSTNTQSFDSLGDMDAYKINLGYSFLDNFYINSDYTLKNLSYASTTLKNENLDVFLRYQIYEGERFAFAIDGGYVTNRANDIYIYDINTINDTISRITSSDVSFSSTNDTYYLNYLSNGTSSTATLNNKPYVALVDTYDEAFYLRGIVSYKTENSLWSVFGGFKEIKVVDNLDSSLAHETSTTIQDAISNNNVSTSYKFNRTDAILFGGFNLVYTLGSFHTHLGYKLNKIYRIDCIETNVNNEKTDINHIVDLNFAYDITDNLSFYLGGRLMTNQFNGEIHYLYTEFTNTTFDHKYGYANTGLVYRF